MNPLVVALFYRHMNTMVEWVTKATILHGHDDGLNGFGLGVGSRR